MTEKRRGSAANAFADIIATIDDEIEDLAISGGITADIRGDLSVDTLLHIVRWRSVQSIALYSDWADNRDTSEKGTNVAFAAAKKASQFVD